MFRGDQQQRPSTKSGERVQLIAATATREINEKKRNPNLATPINGHDSTIRSRDGDVRSKSKKTRFKYLIYAWNHDVRLWFIENIFPGRIYSSYRSLISYLSISTFVNILRSQVEALVLITTRDGRWKSETRVACEIFELHRIG